MVFFFICGVVHYQFSSALKLAKKYEIEHWSRSSKTINWSADSFQINHVTSMSWHTSPRYGHVILVSGYPILTAVNWPFCECQIYKMFTCQDTPETPPPLPFDSLPYPTITICRRVRTLGQSRDNQMKRGWSYSMSMGLCPTRASREWEPRHNTRKTKTSCDHDKRCSLFGKAQKSVAHVLSVCSALAQTKYLYRHNAVHKILYFELLRNHKLMGSGPPCYSPTQPKSMYGNNHVTAFWDVPVYADKTEWMQELLTK